MKKEIFRNGPFETPGSTGGLGKPGPASDPVSLGSQERPDAHDLPGDVKAATGFPGKAK